MKKLLLFISVLALTILASCQKETFKDSQAVKYGSIILEAEVEMPALSDTKTVLNGTAVEWRRGDLIKVFSKDGSSIKMEAQGDGTSVQFREVVEGEEAPITFDPTYAIYPYSEEAEMDGSILSFTAPSQQTYVENSFGPKANVAFGKILNGKLQFKNAFGVLKFSLKGIGTVEKITLKGNNEESLCGKMSVDMDYSVLPSVVIEGGQSDNKIITLNCLDEDNKGIELSQGNPVAFYFVVPAGSFSEGFTAEAYCGAYNHSEVATPNNNVVSRSKVKAMNGAKEAYILPKEYIQLDWIESTGTQYIEGPVVLPAETTIETEFACGVEQSQKCIIGSRTNPDDAVTALQIYVTDNFSLRCAISPNIKPTPFPMVVDKFYKVVINKKDGGFRIGTIDGLTNNQLDENSHDLNTNSPYVFCRNKNGMAEFHSSCKMKYVKYYQYGDIDEIATHYLVPALINGEAGMFDIVENIFYENKGKGKFRFSTIAVDYIDVAFLESTGSQYIELEGINNVDATTEVCFAPTKIQKNACIIGTAYTGNSQVLQSFIANNDSFGLRCGMSPISAPDMVPLEVDRYYTIINNKKDGDYHIGLIDGVENNRVKASELDVEEGMYYIFARNNIGASVSSFSSIRVKYVKIYDFQTGELICHLVPKVAIPVGTPGLYDVLNDKFYTNSGKDEFIAGPKSLMAEYEDIY